jgi:hypothetical protein
MLAGPKGLDGEGFVQVVGRGHQHEVDVWIGQESFPALEGPESRLPRRLQPRGVDIVRADDPDAVHFGCVAGVPVSHAAITQNSHSNGHRLTAPYSYTLDF